MYDRALRDAANAAPKKGKNVMVDDSGLLFVIDFGFSKDCTPNDIQNLPLLARIDKLLRKPVFKEAGLPPLLKIVSKDTK